MKRNTWTVALTCVLAFGLQSLAPAAEPQAAAEAPAFKTLLPQMTLEDGDTLVFLGDSITHQCLYTQYVEDFYYTRFPKLHIHFHNAGVGGDRASDALVRSMRCPGSCLRKPSPATICFAPAIATAWKPSRRGTSSRAGTS